MTDDEFLAAFEGCTLTRPEWTHEAHVRMAWAYLTRLPIADALKAARSGILRLNAAFGNSTGYHETITVAFVRVIAHRLQAGDDFPTFRGRNPDLLDRTLPALLRHYTKDRLFSAEARAAFIDPDLEPLPG